MKYLISIIVLALVITMTMQAQWILISSPNPDNADLRSVYFTTPDSGHAVGAGGTYLRYSDSAWYNLPNPSNDSFTLEKITATENGNLYICGGSDFDGLIVKSTDASETWVTKYNVSGNYVADIAFFNDSIGIAVGRSELILRTTDGGENWTQVSSPVTMMLMAVDFSTDGQIGIAVGSMGAILRSTDGGASWSQVSSPTDITLKSVSLSADSQIGIAVGLHGLILRTTDGGASWSQVSSHVTITLESVSLSTDGQIGIVVGHGGTIINTTNGGIDWKAMNSNVTSLLGESFIMPDFSTWVVGRDYVILYNAQIPLDIKSSTQTPTQYQLSQNYPNPFNPITTIEYEIPNKTVVILSIYDIQGRLVEKLINQVQPTGNYSIQWDASNNISGVYFYKIETNGFQQVRKCLLIK